MTRKRAGAVFGTAYSPDESLIQRYTTTYPLKKRNLTAVLSEFGPLPEVGQEQLIRCLVLTSNRYQFAAKTIERVTPGKQRDLLKAVETTSRKLLLQLGISVKNVSARVLRERSSNHPPSVRGLFLGMQTPLGMMVNSWLSQAGIGTANRDAASVNTDLSVASNDLANSITGLLYLHDRAKEAVQSASAQTTQKRGGPRHRPGPRGELIRDAIAIYEHLRAQYPESGNRPGLGEPIRGFVRAVGALFDVSMTDLEINEGWRHRRSNPK